MMPPQIRRQALAVMPNLIADGYDLPRTNIQSVLQRIVENITELQRRGA